MKVRSKNGTSINLTILCRKVFDATKIYMLSVKSAYRNDHMLDEGERAEDENSVIICSCGLTASALNHSQPLCQITSQNYLLERGYCFLKSLYHVLCSLQFLSKPIPSFNESQNISQRNEVTVFHTAQSYSQIAIVLICIHFVHSINVVPLFLCHHPVLQFKRFDSDQYTASSFNRRPNIATK